jgi:hypothetical protein
MNNEEIKSEILAFLQHHEMCRDEYQQWAVKAIDVYQDLLVQMGLADLSVVVHYEQEALEHAALPGSDDMFRDVPALWIDGLLLRDALGNVVTIPDPNDRPGSERVVEFFCSLMRQPQRNIKITTLFHLAQEELKAEAS